MRRLAVRPDAAGRPLGYALHVHDLPPRIQVLATGHKDLDAKQLFFLQRHFDAAVHVG